MKIVKFNLLIFVIFCVGCSSSDTLDEAPHSQRYQKAEYIYRTHDSSLFSVTSPKQTPSPSYPWKNTNSCQSKITKEYFRCKGTSLNPCHVITQKNEIQRYYDCGGIEKHSLPLRNGKEFIYPILIDLINYVQERTGKRAVITSGHRCPEHNTYVDPSPSNQYSKHMIGAEVSFYMQGMENDPNTVVEHIKTFYKITPQYTGQKEYQEFQRYSKETNTAIQPWLNKEIFIKVFSAQEGRNFDNRHPYPYISIQVRYDKDLKENVSYSWEKANRNYLRR